MKQKEIVEDRDAWRDPLLSDLGDLSMGQTGGLNIVPPPPAVVDDLRAVLRWLPSCDEPEAEIDDDGSITLYWLDREGMRLVSLTAHGTGNIVIASTTDDHSDGAWKLPAAGLFPWA